LEAGADIDARTEQGDSALTLAALFGYRDHMVVPLLAAGADTACTNKHGHNVYEIALGRLALGRQYDVHAASECLEWLLAGDGAPCSQSFTSNDVLLFQWALASGNGCHAIQTLVAAGCAYKRAGLTRFVCGRRQRLLNNGDNITSEESRLLHLLECLDATDDPTSFPWFIERRTRDCTKTQRSRAPHICQYQATCTCHLHCSATVGASCAVDAGRH
jgi:hypothetical protein